MYLCIVICNYSSFGNWYVDLKKLFKIFISIILILHTMEHLIDHDYCILPIQDVPEAANVIDVQDVPEAADVVADDNIIQFWPIGDRPKTYKLIPGVHYNEEVIEDNLGFLYFRSKLTEKKCKLFLFCSLIILLFHFILCIQNEQKSINKFIRHNSALYNENNI